jgi:hypothetical protein
MSNNGRFFLVRKDHGKVVLLKRKEVGNKKRGGDINLLLIEIKKAPYFFSI